MTGDPWWHSERHADRRVFLTGRNRIKRALEAWFDGEDFMPVECSALQISPGNETHLHAFATEFRTENQQCSLQHPALLEISEQPRYRLIENLGVSGVLRLNVVVGIPVIAAPGSKRSVEQLHEAYPSLDQPPGQDAVASECCLEGVLLLVCAVQPEDVSRLAFDSCGLGNG